MLAQAHGDTDSGQVSAIARASARLDTVEMPIEPTPDWPEALVEDPDWRAALAMGIDMTLLEENLRMTPAERIQMLESMDELFVAVQGAAWRS